MADRNSFWRKFRGEVRFLAPLSEYTSFRVGGAVDYLAFPADLEGLTGLLSWCAEEKLPSFFLGKGTNLLVLDGGVPGVAISLARGFSRIEEEGESKIWADAGALLGKLVEFATRKGLAGLEFAAGIPGSVGGAIFMNAGAFKGEMKDSIETVRLLDSTGQVVERGKAECGFSYRTMALRQGEVILGGRFRLKAEGEPAVRARVEGIMRLRMTKHPYDLPSAGSVFKNPPGQAAGKLIEETGLKGKCIGDAQVSEKHANFIVNRGRARAQDILALMSLIQEKVWRERGVRLEPEIRIIGQN